MHDWDDLAEFDTLRADHESCKRLAARILRQTGSKWCRQDGEILNAVLDLFEKGFEILRLSQATPNF